MAFNWSKIRLNENDVVPVKNIYKAPEIKSNECTTYFGVDTPACTNRGRHRTEIRLCWDTIQNLKYINEKFNINGNSYKLLLCSNCDDYYIEEDESNEGSDLEQIFKCYECFRKGNG